MALKSTGLTIPINVQHLNEQWFSEDLDEIESYLLSRPQVFWDTITEFIENRIHSIEKDKK